MLPFIKTPKNYVSIRLSGDTAMIYMDMLDTYKLSYQNDWIDDKGIFIYYSIASIENARLCSRPKAIKILKELEEKGYITKEIQKGKPTKIYLVENEYTQLSLEGMKKHKKDKQHRKFAPRKIAKQEEIINEVGVDKVDEEVAITAEPEVQEPIKTITDYTADAKTADNSQSICDTFKAIIGREPDNSFKKCIAKRAVQMNLTAENMRGIIEIAKKARNPEAYILTLTKANYRGKLETSNYIESEQNTPLDEFEIKWRIDMAKYRGDDAQVQEFEQILAIINQKKAEKEAQRPLEQWEIDWLEDMKKYEAEMETKENMLSFNTSAIPPEVRC